MGIFGGGSSSTAFGASTMDVVTKFTWWLAAAFFGFAILAAIAFAESGPAETIPDVKAGSANTSETKETQEGQEDDVPPSPKKATPKALEE